jgi:hypothetical protein
MEPKAQGDFPQLTSRQVTAIIALVTQSLYNPEFAADFFVNPREEFLGYNLSQEEIDQITAYLKYINTLINRDHDSDWIT